MPFSIPSMSILQISNLVLGQWVFFVGDMWHLLIVQLLTVFVIYSISCFLLKDLGTTSCFLLFQKIREPPRKIQKLVVDQRFVRSLAQLPSENSSDEVDERKALKLGATKISQNAKNSSPMNCSRQSNELTNHVNSMCNI